MKRRKTPSDSSVAFWKMSRDFISHRLPDIRKASPNTVKAYREGLNKFIDYLEDVKQIPRSSMSFEYFTKGNVTDFLDWMLNTRNYSEKTCNLRITAINSLLEYAANEDNEAYMAIYLDIRTVKGLKIHNGPIEFFEEYQMKALLLAPDIKNRTGRRNQMMLVLYYDTAARISELLEMTMGQLHLEAQVPYVTILGKGRKYRNIPIMDKTIRHLKRYLKEFHPKYSSDTPLFYAKTHGNLHALSSDTVENMIKKYSEICVRSGISMPAKPHCHMIRKTRAVDLYKGGMPLSHIQQLLGHENMSTTSGFYAFATVEMLAESMKKAGSEDLDVTKKWNDKEVLKRIYSL